MGFLTMNGMLMTYDEYKNKIKCYNRLGMHQFSQLYKAHKDRQIPQEALHWGEEIEYHLYHLCHETQSVKLACDAREIIQQFKALTESGEQAEPSFKLLPEFGNWMIEAVPAQPYGTYSDPEQLLSCYDQITQR